MSSTDQTPYSAPRSVVSRKTPGIYKVSGMGIATWFGGPLVTGCLLYWNFHVTGESQKANYAALLTIPVTALSMWLQLQVPPDFISQQLIFFPQLTSIVIALNAFHGSTVKGKVAEGFGVRSNWMAFRIGILCKFFLLALAHVFYSITGYT
ncbi:MAG: hypothetical protein V4729_07850 [Pseudomonadota bacterium]